MRVSKLHGVSVPVRLIRTFVEDESYLSAPSTTQPSVSRVDDNGDVVPEKHVSDDENCESSSDEDDDADIEVVTSNSNLLTPDGDKVSAFLHPFVTLFTSKHLTVEGSEELMAGMNTLLELVGSPYRFSKKYCRIFTIISNEITLCKLRN